MTKGQTGGALVTLIKPPSGIYNNARGMSLLPPLGICYLASALLKYGHDVKIIDSDIDCDELPQPGTQLIGIGPCLSTSFWRTIELAAECRRICPRATIVLGGPHFTTAPRNILIETMQRFPFVDYVCRGEGEGVIAKLAERASQGFHPLQNMQPEDRILSSDSQIDLSTRELPARELLAPFSSVYKAAVRRQAHQDTRHLQPTTIMASSGCPYQCVFCCSKKKRRIRSPESVVYEMEYCQRKYESRFFIFFDDLFIAPTDSEYARIESLCKLIRKRIPGALWEVELRSDVICRLGERLIIEMYKAGCRTVNIGFEKGYQRGLEKLCKGQTVEEGSMAVRKLKRCGAFTINGTFIIGGEDETPEDVLKTIEMPISLGLDHASFAPLTIHPGTRLYDMAIESGKIIDYWTDYDSRRNYPLYLGKHLSMEEAMRFVREAYRRFYFRKDYLLARFEKAQGYEDLRELLKEFSCWMQRADEDMYYIDFGHLIQKRTSKKVGYAFG